MYKILFDMRNDINDLKKLTLDLMRSGNSEKVQEENHQLIEKIYGDKPTEEEPYQLQSPTTATPVQQAFNDRYEYAEEIEEAETLSLQDKELELIVKALERNKGRRKAAAAELGISERTLYRKIKEYELN